MLVAQLCPSVCDPMDLAHQVPLSMGLCSQEYWSGWLLPSPGDLPNPRIKPGSSALQADSLLSEPPGNLYFSKNFKIVLICICQTLTVFQDPGGCQFLLMRLEAQLRNSLFCELLIFPYRANQHLFCKTADIYAISIIAPIILLTYHLFPVIL